MEEERRGGSDDESSDMEEDSEGELINEKVSEKFIKTLAKIRSKDPSIYKENKEFFKGKWIVLLLWVQFVKLLLVGL